MSIGESIQDDPFYSIFLEHLHSGLYDDQSEDVFLNDVAEFYLHRVRAQGFVPIRLQEPLRNDLIEEVKIMLRAKIYGHYSIGAYNRARNSKSG